MDKSRRGAQLILRVHKKPHKPPGRLWVLHAFLQTRGGCTPQFPNLTHGLAMSILPHLDRSGPLSFIGRTALAEFRSFRTFRQFSPPDRRSQKRNPGQF